MDRNKFIKKIEKEKVENNITWQLELIKSSIESNMYDGNPRGHRNLIIVMEELSELSKEVAKQLRGKGDGVALLEEIADVQCGIYYLQDIFNISKDEIQRAIQVKLKHLESVLKENGTYK